MQEVETWFYTLIVRGDQEEDDVAYWERVLKGVKTRLHESYKNGQKSKAA